MTTLPPPDPATRHLTPWLRRQPWSAWLWVVFAVALLAAFMVARIFI